MVCGFDDCRISKHGPGFRCRTAAMARRQHHRDCSVALCQGINDCRPVRYTSGREIKKYTLGEIQWGEEMPARECTKPMLPLPMIWRVSIATLAVHDCLLLGRR